MLKDLLTPYLVRMQSRLLRRLEQIRPADVPGPQNWGATVTSCALGVSNADSFALPASSHLRL